MIIHLAREAGFCFGVERAIDMVQAARESAPERPIDILNEIVHNRHVIDDFARQDVRSVNSVDGSRDGIFVISAHGVSPEVVKEAHQRGLEVLDVTCPLVTKIHRTAEKLVRQGYEVLLLGDEGHDEVEGVLGVAPAHIHRIRQPEEAADLPSWERVALVSQTTQGMAEFDRMEEALRRRFPHIEVHNTICHATEQRQEAIVELAREAEAVIVVGSANSANACRLRDIAADMGRPAWLIEDESGLEADWVRGRRVVGVSAGASTPDKLIRGVIERLESLGGTLRPLPGQDLGRIRPGLASAAN
ncbi:MAG: 4-hydroxy-3-methylbut-2-enyl diphosphate reductase [bacterium]|jgi:4-hydroxy-3-methylbut-2-enyl diphosphate reductase|nr:4-hydroxy-3-methylbut-2-enyl diphosphate reductase [bacterium]